MTSCSHESDADSGSRGEIVVTVDLTYVAVGQDVEVPFHFIPSAKTGSAVRASFYVLDRSARGLVCGLEPLGLRLEQIGELTMLTLAG